MNRWAQYAVLLTGAVVIPQADGYAAIGASINESTVQRTYYVNASSGDNGNSGTSSGSAVRDLSVGLDKANNDGTGSKVVIAAGTYVVAGEVGFGPADELLILEGVQKGSVVIQCDAGTNQTFYMDGKRNVVLRKLSFNGGSSAVTIGLARWNPLTDNRNWLIEDCEFSENDGAGLSLESMHNLTMRRCSFVHNGYEGAKMTLIDAELIDCRFVRNHYKAGWVNKVWDSGLNISGDNVTFTRCAFDSNTNSGIQSDLEAETFLFDNCSFSGNGYAGAKWEIARGPITFTNCTFLRNQRAVNLETTYDVTFDRCRFSGNTDFVLSITWKLRDQLEGMPNVWSNGGDGDLRVPAGSSWIYKTVMDGTLRTTMKNCVIVGPKIYRKRVEDTDYNDYAKWCRDEFTGQNNVYYNATSTSVFETTNSGLVDFTTWKSYTGTDTDSRWSSDTLAGTVAVGTTRLSARPASTASLPTVTDISGRRIVPAAQPAGKCPAARGIRASGQSGGRGELILTE